MAALFTDKQERARLSSLTSVLTDERIIADAGAYSGFLLARPEVTESAIGTTGYCLGGRMSLIAAGGLGREIAAAASFRGGRLAVAGDPSSPHLSADHVTATDSRYPTTRLTTPKRTTGTGKRSTSSTELTSKAPEAHAMPGSSGAGATQRARHEGWSRAQRRPASSGT